MKSESNFQVGDLVIFKHRDVPGCPVFLKDAMHGVVTDVHFPDRWPGTDPSAVIEVRWSKDASRVYHHDAVQLEVISR
jgi:hypothetical protein